MARYLVAVAVAAITGGAIALASHDSGPDSPGETSAASHIKTVGCASTIKDVPGPANQDDLVVGPVILRGALGHGRKAPSTYKPRQGRDAIAKMGIVLQPETELILSIHKKQRRHASLAYTKDARAPRRVADGQPAVRFESCSGETPSGWPGGFVLSGPRCVRIALDIRGHEAVEKRKIEFGRDTC